MKAVCRVTESFRKQSLPFLILNACFCTTVLQTALVTNPVPEMKEVNFLSFGWTS